MTPQIPSDFSSQERFLVQATEQAILDGLPLERWSRDPNRKTREFPLDLNRPYKLKNKAFGYFSDVLINGQTRTALGCRQEVEFGKIDAPNPEELLKEYVLNEFMNTASWVYEDGAPGGFTLKQMVYCDIDGKCGRYSDSQLTAARHWGEIGTKYAWSLLTIYLHDFVIQMGDFKKGLSEAVSVVQHPEFIHIVENPKPGYKLEVAIGYPFINYAPIPNFFGFGPGKFNWAVKTFSFLLRDNNEVRCDMDFIAGARAKKVFDFGKNIPCPIYGTADALGALTMGIFPKQAVHDFMDGVMATQHGRVHQALMEGSSKVFAAWLADKAQAAASAPASEPVLTAATGGA